jgi:hypothetical protein
VTTLRVTSWDEFTLISRILQIRFIVFWFIEFFMQQIFNLFINMIIIESTSINNFLKFFISSRTTIESISRRMLSSKMNWILLLRIVFSSINSSIICSFNETTMIMKIMFYERFFMTNSRIESLFNLISLLSKSETIWEFSATFTMFESIITSNLIVQKSTSCWRSFDSIEIMSKHSNKLNELRIIMKFCLESSKNENMKSMTSQISTTRRFILSNRRLNQIVTSNTSFSMIDTSDFLHLMIKMICISCCRRNFDSRMRILRFVINSSIAIILILHFFSFHHLILSRFVHLSLQQSINHFVLKINMRVLFFICICFESACSFCIVICNLCLDFSKFNRWKLLWIDIISIRIKLLQEIVAIEQNL